MVDVDTGELGKEDLIIDHGSAFLLPILNVPAIALDHELPIGAIKDVTACHGRANEVLILAHTGVYSLDLEDPGRLRKLTITGSSEPDVPYYYRSCIVSHNDHVYLSCYNRWINKFQRTDKDTLNYISNYPHGATAIAIDDHSHLYCILSSNNYDRSRLHVIDAETMLVICILDKPFAMSRDLVVAPDNRVHVATDTGVFVCDNNAEPVGVAYLEGYECHHITINYNTGIIAVGLIDTVAIVSADSKSICFVLQNWPITRCAIIGDEFMFYNNTNIVLPQAITSPPCSLFSLCMSAILSELESQPISLLPPRLSTLLAPWNKRVMVELVKKGAVCGRYPLQLKPSLTRQGVAAIVSRKKWLDCKSCPNAIHKVCSSSCLDTTTAICSSCDSRTFLVP